MDPKKPWYKNLFLWYFLIGVITLTALRPFLKRVPEPPPLLHTLAPFAVQDQNGNPFTNSSLEGSAWVANFIFTRCPSICPLLTQHMLGLQQRFAAEGVDSVRLLSISVDPEFDTVDVLHAYAAAVGADPQRWQFVTGDTEAVRALVVDGFRTAMGIPEKTGDGLMDITHSGFFVIVDERGGIRGYYPTDGDGLDEIFHRAQHVADAAD